MMSGLRTACLLSLALVPGWAGAQAQDYPFVGSWDCGGSTFAFTDTTYDNGAGTQTMSAVTAEGSGFILTFANGQELVLSEFSGGKMVWLLWSTGERRDCTRLD